MTEASGKAAFTAAAVTSPHAAWRRAAAERLTAEGRERTWARHEAIARGEDLDEVVGHLGDERYYVSSLANETLISSFSAPRTIFGRFSPMRTPSVERLSFP